MKKQIVLVALNIVFYSSLTCSAEVNLFEFALNVDGTVSNPTQGDPTPAAVDLSGFDGSTGLGSITFSLTGAGSHYFGAFLDHEIDEPINTFFNELGAVSGAPQAGQSWEIDEPGFGAIPGDIFDNFLGGTLDNSIGFAETED